LKVFALPSLPWHDAHLLPKIAAAVLGLVLGELFCGSAEPVADATSVAISVNAKAKGSNACFIDLISRARKDDEIPDRGC